MRKWLTNTYYSFPVQLLVLHLRGNLVLIALWVFLVVLVSDGIGSKYGIKYLFLSPEYLGEVGFWSFFFLGLAFGAMVMSWNLTTYLISAHYFPFLATLARPFTKFSINNLLVPVGFTVLLLTLHIRFEWYYEFRDLNQIFLNCLGFLFGMATLIVSLLVYFYFTNKDILSFLRVQDQPPPHLVADLAPGRRPVDYEGVLTGRNRWRVDTYLTESLRFRLVRSVAHYDSRIIMRVFKQNHINALIVQLFSLVLLVTLGYLIDNPYFRIPAAASILLIMSILIALTGAISYWFHRWRIAVLLLLFASVNYITKYEWFNHKNKAYGLNYQTPPATYDYDSLASLCSPQNVQEDMANTIAILDNWKKTVAHEQEGKPKMVLFMVSGGGLKSAVWSMQVMRYADSLSNGRLMDYTTLIAGASGGLIGSAYYRELYLRKLRGAPIDPNDPKYVDNVGRDLLNSVTFTIASNDLFLPWIKFEAGGYTYVKDRGYAFERQLNENVEGVFNGKSVSDYWLPEQWAQIPMMFITPSIVNDGRRMVISPHGVSYMMAAPIAIRNPNSVEIDAVDFGRLFEEQDGSNLLVSSALRMNATFPYILPNVYLPTQPNIELMDAGFRDDFGLKSAIRFLHVFKDWIRKNTSGVVLVQVRAFDRERKVPASDNQGVIESIFNPLGIAGKIVSLQNYEHDTNLGFLYDILGEDRFEIIRFTYLPSLEHNEATISFHLTQRERNDILHAIDLESNRKSLERLVEVMRPSKPMSLE